MQQLQLSSAKPPSSCRSIATDHTYATQRTGITKRTTAGRKAIKVIDWYFYPEFAPKRLFKNQCVKQDLKQVTGKHYDVLSQASNAWSHSSRTVP